MTNMNEKEHINQEKYIEDDDESSFEDSIGSSLSSCSSDLMDEENSSSSSSNGPLYELSELMAQLPIKRGLSKYYQGKSQTFTSLASVTSLEDLVKRGRPIKKKMKSYKSYYAGGLDHHIFRPKAIISKKKNSRMSLQSIPKISRSGVELRLGDCNPFSQ